MYGCEHWYWSFWWFFPLIMIIMMIGCIFMMRRSRSMKGGIFPSCCMPGEKDLERFSESSAQKTLKSDTPSEKSAGKSMKK